LNFYEEVKKGEPLTEGRAVEKEAVKGETDK